MKFDELLNQTAEWLKTEGPNSDIVLSSRIRLARNLHKFPFAHWANKKQEEEVLNAVMKSAAGCSYLKKGLFLNMKDLSNVDKQFLIERHLISKEHALDADSKAVIISEKEIVSIMVNEEDHLRIQVMQSGFNLTKGWHLIEQIDGGLQKGLNYAWTEELGFLTACPTNVGTGMRASVMLHLPALVMTKQIGKVLQAISKLTLAVRGLYGEGTEAAGNLFQISNQVTLGQTENDVIINIEGIIRQIVGHEENARKTVFSQNKAVFEDRIWRAYGLLSNARIISSNETLGLLSAVRLGVDMGVIKNIDRKVVNELFLLTQPAHLQKIEKKVLNVAQRDINRAELIREKLKG